ncbi:MFS general substrate transporter [Violaceomyces palustris]|uniref:MFS general substrate transporter n=1 Tax=Violaceomyces palustris TaxID=1673888 RepID=A0ACD0P246_9BASI|nr:MFS general substrate transporter [Violaceomyces palustris]
MSNLNHAPPRQTEEQQPDVTLAPPRTDTVTKDHRAPSSEPCSPCSTVGQTLESRSNFVAADQPGPSSVEASSTNACSETAARSTLRLPDRDAGDDASIESHQHHRHDLLSLCEQGSQGAAGASLASVNNDGEPQLQDQTNFLPRKQIIIVFAGLSLALFIALLDQTIVSTALPTIISAFESGSDSSWLSTSYLVTSTAMTPLYGRFSDIFGRKFCLILALSLFLVGSALCSAAQSMTQLIVFRAIAGMGGGGIVTLVMVVVSDIVSLRERGKYQGLLGMVVAISNSGGPLVGGSLAQVSWRWCFIVAVPIIVVAMVAVIFLLPLKKVEGNVREKLGKADYLGSLLILVGTVLLLLGLNWGGQAYAWSSAHVVATLTLGAASLVAFGLVEWKVAKLPIVPLRLFGIGTVSAVMVQTTCSGAIFYLLLFFVPQYTQVVKGYSGVLAGVTLIPLMALQAITSTLAGLAVSKLGRYKAIIVIGFVIFSIGVGLLALLDQESGIGEVIGFLLLSGFGAGGTLQTTLVAAQNAVQRKDMAVVTSLRNFLRLLGGTLSLAVSFAILNNTVSSQVVDFLPPEVVKRVVRDPTQIRGGPLVQELTEDQRRRLMDAYVKGFRNVFYFGLGCVLVALLVMVLFVKELPLDKKDDQKRKEEGKVEGESSLPSRQGRGGSGSSSTIESRKTSR